jgi:hypothetical protein
MARITQRQKRITVLLLVVCILTQLVLAISAGRHGEWLLFGLSLALSLFLQIVFVSILLVQLIDSRFDEMRIYLESRDSKESQEK